jgi:hypothetical protein
MQCGVIPLVGVLAVITSSTAFEDVHTDFGFLPFQVSGLAQMINAYALIAVFAFKEVAHRCCTPEHAPSGVRGVVKLKWVEPALEEEMSRLSSEGGMLSAVGVQKQLSSENSLVRSRTSTGLAVV